MSSILSRVGFKILGIEYEVRRMDLLHRTSPAVIISNHQNNFDMFPGGGAAPRNCVLLGKKNIVFIPFFGQFFWLAGNFLIDRKNKRKSKISMSKITEGIVSKKISIWILPEGTRSRGRGLLPFKKGAFITAIDAKVPLIQVCFSTYHKKMNFNKWKSGKIIAQVLNPIETLDMNETDVATFAERCHSMMSEQITLLDTELAL